MSRTILPICAFLLALGPVVAREPSKELQKEILAAIQSGNADAAVAKVRALGDLDSAEAVQALIQIAGKIDALNPTPQLSNAVFNACVETLGELESAEARSELLELLADKKSDWRIKVLLIEAAEQLGTDEAGAALAELLAQKKQPERVLIEAARAAGRLRVGAAVSPLIDLAEKNEKVRNDVWLEARLALTAITGEDIEKIADWKSWWRGQEDSFRPETGDTPFDPGSTTVMKDVPSFFGTEIVSKRIVLIIDVSGSMEAVDPVGPRGTTDGVPGSGAGEDRMRITRAKKELVRLLESLPREVQFSVIKYSTDVVAWKNELAQATPGNIQDAVKWAQAIQHNGVTATGSALEKAFEIGGEPNQFILISDGSPTDSGGMPLGEPDLDKLLAQVEVANKFRKVRVDTIGFPGALPTFMTALATANGGEYRALD